MKFTSSKGETHDFKLSVKAMIALEAEDPDFSIVTVGDRLEKTFRMTDFATLANCLGWDLEDFLDHGYSLKDLSTIFIECFNELGFTSEQDTPTI